MKAHEGLIGFTKEHKLLDSNEEERVPCDQGKSELRLS